MISSGLTNTSTKAENVYGRGVFARRSQQNCMIMLKQFVLNIKWIMLKLLSRKGTN